MTLPGTLYSGWLLAFAASLILVNYLDHSESPKQGLGLDAPLVITSLVFLPAPIGGLVALCSKAVAIALRRRELGSAVLFEIGTTTVGVMVGYGALQLARARSLPEAVVVLVVAVGYLAVTAAAEGLALRFRHGRPWHTVPGTILRSRGLLWGAQLSVALLMEISAERIEVWSLALSIALLVLVRQAYALLSEANETYDQTVRVIVEALEGQRGERVGHAQRVSAMSARIGERLGLPPQQLQSVSITALLHDVGRDAQTGLTGDRQHTRSSAVTRGSMHLGHAHPALEVLDGIPGQTGARGEVELRNAFIVAVASDADDLALGRESDSLASCVAPLVDPETRGAVFGAAVALGYSVPALATE